MTRILESNSIEDTLAIGEKLGRTAKPGDIYALIGDLGVGKTAMAQGFAAGLGIAGPISSPTFTILMEYTEGRLPFYHFDVYRIGDLSELDEIGFEECLYGEGVTLVEWADLVWDAMPKETIMIRIEKDLEKGFDYRKIMVEE